MLSSVSIPPLAPSIEWGALRLRALRSTDAASLLAYLEDPVVIEHTSYPVQSLRSVELLIATAQQGYAERTSCKWALAWASDDVAIGTCGFNNWAPDHASAELAYDLAPRYWGKRLMSQAVGVAVDWAFTAAGFNRIHALVMVSNARSSRLLSGCGFHQEAMLRSYRIARTVPRDFWMYSLLKSEWTDRAPTP
jgi:[ribosomal protein S5]-alanine N-acetyltransferase